MTGEEFKATRKRLGKTQAEIAYLLGVSQEMVSQIENGSRQATPELLESLGKLGMFGGEK